MAPRHASVEFMPDLWSAEQTSEPVFVDRLDAYNNIGIIAALLAGLSLQTLTAVTTAELEAEATDAEAVLFVCLNTFVIIANLFTVLTVTMIYYYAKLYTAGGLERLAADFLKKPAVRTLRHSALYAFWLSLPAFLVGTLVAVRVKLANRFATLAFWMGCAYGLGSLLLCGALALVVNAHGEIMRSPQGRNARGSMPDVFPDEEEPATPRAQAAERRQANLARFAAPTAAGGGVGAGQHSTTPPGGGGAGKEPAVGGARRRRVLQSEDTASAAEEASSSEDEVDTAAPGQLKRERRAARGASVESIGSLASVTSAEMSELDDSLDLSQSLGKPGAPAAEGGFDDIRKMSQETVDEVAAGAEGP